MKTIQITGVSFPVSQICLGCAFFGSRESKELSYELMDYYYSQGGRFFNTSLVYAGGESERILGSWVRERGVRSEVVLTSKSGQNPAYPQEERMLGSTLTKDIDESLTRMGLDCLDFYMLHVDNRSVPVEEILPALHEAQKAGKIRHYGCSNWHPDRQREAAAFARANGMQGFVVDEVEFNLARNNRDNNGSCNWVDESYIELHEADGICVGAYSALASGALSQYVRDGSTVNWRPWCAGMFDNPYNMEIAKRLKKLCDETGWTASQIQLAWLADHPFNFPTFSIIGASKVSQLEDSLQAHSITLTPEMISYLRPDYREYL